MPLVVIAYCPQKSENAGRPGTAPLNNVQLNAIRPANLGPDDEDPNAKIFDSSNGNVSCGFNGVTDEVAAQFKGGKKYKITIEEIV